MHATLQADIKTMSLGGGGGNTVYNMLKDGYQDNGLTFIVANTDQQALLSAGDHALVIGEGLTKGLGAGAKPEIGRQAAEESESEIRMRLEGADMLFLTAGMGGGTGTGAAPVVARIARDMGILTVAVVTLPFGFEGPKRRRIADVGVAELAEVVDSLIIIPNEKLLRVMGQNGSLLAAFETVNNVLKDAVLGISDMITSPGMINVDFADVFTVMSNKGVAKIGTGEARGENRAEEAVLKAINSPLLEDIEICGARGLLVNITAGPDMSIGEFNTVGETLRSYVGDEATVVIGTSLDMGCSEYLRVAVVATGLGEAYPAGEEDRQFKQPASFVRLGSSQPAKSAARSRHEKGDDGLREHEPARLVRSIECLPANTAMMSTKSKATGTDLDYLDIPSFLRREPRG